MRRTAGVAAAAAAAMVTLTMAGGIAQAQQYGSVRAVTRLADRPDSGDNGYWADDNFRRTVSLADHGSVPAADCGELTGQCFDFTFTIADRGTFTTIAGQPSPRSGANLDLAVTGSMTGGTSNGQFYATSADAAAWRVPKYEDDHGTVPSGEHTTENWVEQFFPAGTVFSSAASPGSIDLGTTAGWTYRLDFGQDPQCPNDAYQWVDAAPDWGAGNANGDILAPGTASCT